MVQVALLVAQWCPVCPSAKRLWGSLWDEYPFEYREVDISTDEGERIVEKHHLLSVPTTLIDGKVAFVGVPDREEAMREVRK